MRRTTVKPFISNNWSCHATSAEARTGVYPDPDQETAEETEGTLFALARVVEQRDEHTAGHCERLALISVSLGFAMGLDTRDLLALYRGGYLHDIGKVGIPDSILFKPGRLTSDEWGVMRSHAVRGEEICRHVRSLKPVLPIIRNHHERFDGTGYPDGLAGEDIPLLARVLQVADIYDALISHRPYKSAFLVEDALKTLEVETARGWRDPQIVELFFRLHAEVITKITEYATGPERSLLAMGDSLSGMQHFLSYASA
jgi:putative two-component system response regulator